MQVLPLDQLIGGPVRAIVLAQGIAAQSAAQFLSEVGFTRDRQDEGPAAARTVAFTYIQPVADPEKPGQVINTPVRVTVPLLVLTSIPNVQIAEGTVSFQANVVEVRATDLPSGAVNIEAKPSVLFRPPVDVLAVYATPGIGGPEPTPGGNLAVSVKVVREPLPEGFTRVMHLLQDAITAEPVEER
jgi:hypothetical protein